MIKIIFGLGKVFQKPWNNFRILSSVSMKYWFIRKKENAIDPQSLHYQKIKRDMKDT